MDKSSEHVQYAVNRLEGSILRGMEHALTGVPMPMDIPMSTGAPAPSMLTAQEPQQVQDQQPQHQQQQQQQQQPRLPPVPEIDVTQPHMFSPDFEHSPMGYQGVTTSVDSVHLPPPPMLSPEAMNRCSSDGYPSSMQSMAVSAAPMPAWMPPMTGPDLMGTSLQDFNWSAYA